MTLREMLRTKPSRVITVALRANVADAARLLMDHGVGGLPVIDARGSLVGFVSERQVVEAVHRHAPAVHDVGIEEIMRRPAPVCGLEDPIRGVMERMTSHRLRHLVVVDGGRIAGVISVGDLVKHRLDELETETGVLRDFIAAQRALR